MGTAINTIITFIVSGALGYCVSIIKNYKKRAQEKTTNEKLQNEALLSLLKSNLSNTYFIYKQARKIPDYIYQVFLDQLEIYEMLGGDGFIHTIAKKMESWEIIKTDIL